MRETIESAIALYKQNDLAGCESLLSLLLSKQAAKSAEAYARRGAVPPIPLVPYSYVSLAVDRLKKEQGADIVAVSPVLLSLNTALQYA